MNKVLLIEPDRILGQTLKTSLSSFGFDVKTKANAQMGLDGVDGHKPDVIVLEVQLDKHNGVEFLYELRSHEDWQEIPVVIHTANPSVLNKKFEKAWNELGVKKILYKPETSLEKLAKNIQKS